MKLPKAFIMLHNVVITLTRRHSDLAFRGSQLSHQKQFQDLQQSIRLSNMKKRHNDEDELLKVKFDKLRDDADPEKDPNYNPETADYSKATKAVNDINIEYYSEMNSQQSKHSSEEQQVIQENKAKEVPMDMEIEQNNTQIQVVSADLESYQKALENALKGDGMD